LQAHSAKYNIQYQSEILIAESLAGIIQKRVYKDQNQLYEKDLKTLL
jgi:hypothetical protein